jgi:hypothetical protein
MVKNVQIKDLGTTNRPADAGESAKKEKAEA